MTVMFIPDICPVCHMRYIKRTLDDTICQSCRTKRENAQQPIKTQKTKPNIKKQNESRVKPNTPKKEQKEIKTEPKGIEKICLTCGKVFIAKDNRQKYCSAECRYRYWRPGKKSVKKIKKETVVYDKQCAICGADFSTILPQQIYCSAKCAKTAHKNKKYMLKICVKCGAQYKTRHNTTKYCPACASEFMTATIK